MPKFNLKKQSQSIVLPYPKMLAENNAKHGLSEIDNPGTTEYLLNKNVRKNIDNTEPYERQLKNVRHKDASDRVITDKALDNEPNVFNERRRSKEYDAPIPTVQLLAEGFDQKKREAFNAGSKEKRDTAFWDKYVGVQMLGETTKVPDNISPSASQLENQQDRFKELKDTQPVKEDLAKNDTANQKENKIEDMVTASLKNADALLFHIYATAASNGRELIDEEEKIIENITASKISILSPEEDKSEQLV